MDIDKYSKEIHKTGYVLENSIAIKLKQAGWTVISNKYYEDDFTNSIREIDLLAYKVAKVQHFDVYTTLLISCKKNESNTWALLSRDINLNNPNSDWWPLHTWSNDKALQYELSQPGRSKTYHNEIASLGVTEALSIPEVEVFAFQEMNSTSGVPKNDSSIFNAVTSLMKAQAYELSALPHRKKAPAIYQFNLISINDSELIRLKFIEENVKAEQINSEHYIARYIIKKSETFSRIRFIKASHFKDALLDYNRLHKANSNWFDMTINKYFSKVVTDPKRVKVYLDDFREKIGTQLNLKMQSKFGKKIELKSISLEWNIDEDKLAVTFPSFDTNIFEFFNQDDSSKNAIANALNDIYRYSGNFYFSNGWEIPF